MSAAAVARSRQRPWGRCRRRWTDHDLLPTEAADLGDGLRPGPSRTHYVATSPTSDLGGCTCHRHRPASRWAGHGRPQRPSGRDALRMALAPRPPGDLHSTTQYTSTESPICSSTDGQSLSNPARLQRRPSFFASLAQLIDPSRPPQSRSRLTSCSSTHASLLAHYLTPVRHHIHHHHRSRHNQPVRRTVNPTRLPLADAKCVAHDSQTWADVRGRDDEWQDSLVAEMDAAESRS